MRSSQWKTLLAMLFAFALVAAACSGDDDTTSSDTTEAAADTTEAPADTETTEAPADTETTEAMEDDGGDLAGTTVTVFGSESSDEEAGAMQDALDVFAEQTGINIQFTGARDFSDQINAQVAGGNAPDIGIYPQPGKVAELSR